MKFDQHLARCEGWSFDRIENIYFRAFAVTKYERSGHARLSQFLSRAEPPLNNFAADTIDSCKIAELLPVRILDSFKRNDFRVGDFRREPHCVVAEGRTNVNYLSWRRTNDVVDYLVHFFFVRADNHLWIPS